MNKLTYLIVLLLGLLNAEGQPYEGPNDSAGDIGAERAAFMNGNRVLSFFRNTTEIGDCCYLGYYTSKWPNNYDGSAMHDGIALLIGARIYLENDTIPITDLNLVESIINSGGEVDTLYYIQSSYREFMDIAPTGDVEWALYPPFGYSNEFDDYPAMSNRPDSWPIFGWPSINEELKWQGEWNGRFGRGITKADLESFVVVNDAQDQENLGELDIIKYYPRPGIKIGNSISVQSGKPWGGLGIRIEQRGFQWMNPQAMDAIFWEYTIANISDYDIPEMFFGTLLDNAVGGESGDGDDLGYYDLDLNLCFSWDIDATAVGGGTPGILGFAFLESPGISDDFIDNDNDGLIDEKRDNDAGEFIFGPIGNYGEPIWHWFGDEDGDWSDGFDENENGIYDIGEDPGDDIGLDGVGPYDINYSGPDEDGTECNHKPDLLEGVGAEPNFGYTDVDESDMLGLTSFRYQLSWDNDDEIIKNDKQLFEFLNTGEMDLFQNEARNFLEYFASGTFNLEQGKTERISVAELHSYDPITGQDSWVNGNTPALFRLKEVVQEIYERDYRFAQPPLMPTLTAVPEDGRVILSWDNLADTQTRDSFLGNINDFEGYKLYRSTDPMMSDAEIITDGFGNPIMKQPIFQCDIIDGKTGFTDFGLLNGVGFYLGDDTGLQHYFIDKDVQNGRTYYYVLVAYDYGVEDVGWGITPSENSYTIELDENENIKQLSSNVAVVIPHQFSAGYEAPFIDGFQDIEIFGSGTISQGTIIPSILNNYRNYVLKFGSEIVNSVSNRVNYGDVYFNNRIYILDQLTREIIYEENADYFSGLNFIYEDNEFKYFLNIENEIITNHFDGISLKIEIPTLLPKVNWEKSGWIKGSSPINITVPDEDYIYFPFDYKIVFTGNENESQTITSVKSINDEHNNPINSNQILLNQNFNFYVENISNLKDSVYDRLDIAIHDVNENGVFDYHEDRILIGRPSTETFWASMNKWAGLAFIIDFFNVNNEDYLPKIGDEYYLTFDRGFHETDSIVFNVEIPMEIDESRIQEDMDKILVVPNPYIATNVMEPALGNIQLNRERRIMFTHIPAQCNIKIFTLSGKLVDEIIVNHTISSSDWDSNSESTGIAHWDLLSREGLEIAGGWYIFVVESTLTKHQKMGKFAIIK